jgi:hypothetical protein
MGAWHQKGIPTVSNFVSGIHTVVSGAAAAMSNRFSAPREAVTSSLNVRLSSTTANVVSTPCELPVTTHSQLYHVSNEILINPEETTSDQQVLVPNHVVAVPPEVTVPDGIQTNARVNADKPGMAASG